MEGDGRDFNRETVISAALSQESMGFIIFLVAWCSVC